MKKKKKVIITGVAVLLLTVLLLGVLQALCMPKYTDNPEGALISEYYKEAGGHDVIFVGDCEVYEGFIPAVLWEKYGISSYVRGSAQQLVWQSYYLLEETFRYESPSAVVFNVLSLKYGEPQREAYNRMTLDGMKWSSSKVSAIKASMTSDENFIDYIFPLLRYHSRITSLTSDDFRYIAGTPAVSDSGYLMQTGVVPMTSERTGDELIDYTLTATSMDYLEKMRKLCEENGAELILIKAPTNNWKYWWYDEWDAQISEYVASVGLKYYNFIPRCDEIGIDWSTDTYDGGIHLNVYGAEKLTVYFGDILKNEFGIADRRADTALAAQWAERVEKYNARKTALENDG